MKKKELVAGIAKEANVSEAEAAKVLAAFIGVTEKALKDGDKVQITGFGTFEVAEREARTGRNPFTGEAMEIKASKAPRFKAGKALKDAIN
ncbi:MAG: HU family DNA-binding protein [Lachnospiraceae bacterium]|nr:HU family DNA-binding protein [Lachnospiraceae bacterium]